MQQIDGGFFEKFGSLLREHSDLATEADKLEREKTAAAAAEVIQSIPEDDDEQTEPPTTTESETESTTSSDSDAEEKATENYFGVVRNVSLSII